MSLAPITLTTDKSTAVIDNAHRKLRQDESGLSITVTVLNEDNTAYDLTGKNLVFCENKQNSKIIIDNGKGDNSGKFNRNADNDTKGIFTYVLQEDVYAASGKAWFEITDGNTVDSTKNFYFDVEKDASISVANNDYVGSLKALETAMAGAQNKVTSDLADMKAKITKQIADTKTANEGEITQALKDLTDQTTTALSNVDEYTKKLATLQSQWNSKLQNIETKANTDTDLAVKAINDKYTNDFAKLKSDFTAWQTSTTQNYQKQVDSILAKVQENGTEVADVQKQVDNTVTKMQTLTEQFSNIDFTQFLKPSALDNYYTKKEVNDKLNTAGKVKTVNHANPDDSGNIQIDTGVTRFNGQTGDITFKVIHDNYDSPQAAFDASKTEDGIHIYDPDNGPQSAVVDGETVTVTKNHDAIVQLQQQFGSLQGTVNDKADSATVYTKSDTDSIVNTLKGLIANAGKLKTITVNGGAKISPDNSGNANITVDLSSKANQSDLNNTNNRVTAIETGYMKKPTVISKADYDKLSTKDPNTLYEITE